MSQETTKLESKEKKLSTKLSRRKHLSIVIIILLIMLGSLYAWIYTAQGLKVKVKNQMAENTPSNIDKSRSLIGKNMYLQKAVGALQNQLATVRRQSAVNNPEPSPLHATLTGKMVVTKVWDQPATDFALPGYKPPQGTPPNGMVRVVYVTLTNPTDSIQTYQALQFSATTDTGVIVSPQIYAPYESTVWNNTKLAPGGTTQVTVLFDTGENYVTLNWSPDGSGVSVVASFPKPSGS